MNILAVDRALSLYSAIADRSETRGARKGLSEHLMETYIEGEKDEPPPDGGRAVILSQSGSGNRLPKLVTTDLSLQSFPLFPQRTPPRDSRLRGANCFRPCWRLLWLWRLRHPFDRGHHWYRQNPSARSGLRSHWAGSWLDFGHAG